MYEQQLFSLEELRNCFEAIKPELIRVPTLDADELSTKVESFIRRFEPLSEEEKS